MRLWKKKKRKTSFNNNRLNLIVAIIFLFVGVIVYKLYDVQIKKYDYYAALAANQQRAHHQLEPRRGKIYIQDSANDDFDKLYLIATNKQYALLYADPRLVLTDKAPQIAAELYSFLDEEKDKKELLETDNQKQASDIKNKEEQTANSQEQALDQNLDNKEEILKTIKGEKTAKYIKLLTKPNDPYEELAKKVDLKTAQAIEDKGWPGINYLVQEYRYYPEGETFAHLTGFVGYKNGKRCGLYGLEGFFNEELAGKPGSLRAEYGADGNLIIVNDRQYKKPIDGSSLILTIVRSIQYTACQKLAQAIKKHGADGGTIIVIKPQTGEILAMCSYPSFDPNNYKEANIENFNNPAIFKPYEPGSVFKPIVMAAALDQGAVTPNTTYVDKGSIKIKGWPKPIKNSDFTTHGPHGLSTMTQVLQESLNTGAIYAMQRIGPNVFARYVKKFGFGEKTGIELETEAKGNIEHLLTQPIKEIYAATASFGQGITVTPLQLAVAYSTIANGGILMKPYLVKAMVLPGGDKFLIKPRQIRRVITDKTSTLLSGMLVSVVEQGHAKRARVNGYYVAGKTGTAQVASKKGGYSDKTIHTFVGYAPADNPIFVMLVKLDDPKDVEFSASSAAPLFSEIAKFILSYYQIPKERK